MGKVKLLGGRTAKVTPKSVTITTEHGSFTAENMRKAKVMAAAAAAELERQKVREEADAQRAYERAGLAAWKIVRTWLFRDDGKLCQCYDFVSAKDEVFSYCVSQDPDGDPSAKHGSWVIHGEDGKAKYQPAHELYGAILGGNGYPLGVVLRAYNDEMLLLSVGICNGIARFEYVPKVSINDFNHMR
jgi:hypothetical protein